MSLTYLSLFSGIGGLDRGLDLAGMNCVGQVELDAYCRTILEHHWPEVPRHDDVRTAGTWWASKPRPRVDVVAGGPPCQPFSRAGKQLGTADERWTWPWMRDVVSVVRPRYVLVENVAALLHHWDAFGTILADLADLGFNAEWSVVSACSLGAPHPRGRVFVLAYPRGEGLEGTWVPGPVADGAGWGAEPAVDRVVDGVSGGVADQVHALGNAVVPAVGEFAGRLIVGHAQAVAA